MEQTIEGHLVVVIDDFHLIQDDPEIRETMNYFLHHLPENIHFLITSRNPLDIDLPNLVAKREASIICERKLAFTADETLKLYSDFFDLSLFISFLLLLTAFIMDDPIFYKTA